MLPGGKKMSGCCFNKALEQSCTFGKTESYNRNGSAFVEISGVTNIHDSYNCRTGSLHPVMQSMYLM